MIVTLVLVRIAKINATPIPQILHFQKKIVKSDFSREEKVFRGRFLSLKSARKNNLYRRDAEAR